MSLPPASPPGTPPRSRTPNPRPAVPSLRISPPTARTSLPAATLAARRVSGHGSLPSAPSNDRPKTRARDLLRKHYGLGVGPPPPLAGKVAQADPMDLDSSAFDARSYYEQLITTSSLTTLLRRENGLLTEIRQLDSERQSLVYNHHHELIAASDTIAAMKSRAENLDADLDLLRAAFSEISRLSSEVTSDDP